ncbi:MAG: hypothetical protein DSM106950_24055 [Stigonema ocellatum SAG 48.90 = DSM 106950]|nr:hypothetical protein [Stigonema ocellatum SAG 48.90 = DSM 106950]
MKTLTTFLKKLRLRQIITVFFAGVLLVASTACSSGENLQGANPDNPAVQAGGANNPYKGGGDKYTNLKMSTDPKVTKTQNNTGNDQSSLHLNSQILIARNSELLYPGGETPEGRAYKEDELPIKTQKDFQQPEAGGIIQREPDLGTRVKERIETVKEAVEEASEFLQHKADEAGARPELRPNP